MQGRGEKELDEVARALGMDGLRVSDFIDLGDKSCGSEGKHMRALVEWSLVHELFFRWHC